jgi:DNA-directed RNA polymerase specialized sigma24 family protein
MGGGILIEQRKTITLNWRPAGTPARRVDDFAEVPYASAARPEPPAPAPGPDRSGITQRCENWGRWAKSSEGPVAAACMTGAICESLRRAELGTAPTVMLGERAIDTADAVLVGRAMVRLSLDQRRILGLLYVDGQRKGFIAALVRFHPDDFDQRLAAAQDALSAALSVCQNSNSK